MWQKATGEIGEPEGKEEEVSLYEVINILIAHGHSKDEILKNYSREEITLFYEKCIKYDMRSNADDIQNVALAVSSLLGSGKQVEKLLADMRK